MKNFSKEDYILGVAEDGITSNLLTTNILNNIDAFVFIYDVEKTKPVWINKYAVKRFGYSNSDLKKVTSEEFLSLFHPKSLQKFITKLKNFDEGDGKAINTLYQLRSKNREWIHMLTCSRVYKKNPDGTIKLLIGYAAEVDPKELKHHVQVMHELNSRAQKLTLVDKLSTREIEVVQLIASGETDKEISEKLGISVHTTRTHRKRIISKLGLKNSAVLIKFAVENGIV
jgi:DNA-binding CsgD family transcriptional regulator